MFSRSDLSVTENRLASQCLCYCYMEKGPDSGHINPEASLRIKIRVSQKAGFD